MAGRPNKDFDAKTFEGLCAIHCSKGEIESVLRTDLRTLEKWCKRHYEKDFSECYKIYSEHGKMSLRRYQFNLAKKNTAMAIWLGKHWLDQKDDKVQVVTAQDLQSFMDQSKNAVNRRNESSPGKPLLENEQSLSHKRQERAKDIIST